jgi:hypothetical protein
VADRIAEISRALNAVQSVGQARVAIQVAMDELDDGLRLAEQLSIFSTPDPTEARTTLSIDRAQLSGELGALDAYEETSPVDAATWSRQRRAVERAFVDVSGIVGVVGSLAKIDRLQILIDAIAEAPRIFGNAAGSVLDAAGRAAGGLGGGFLEGLGFAGLLVVALVAFLVLKSRAIV